MRVITAPHQYEDDGTYRVFLAGGITNCPPWQNQLIELLSSHDLTLFNPRRDNFPINDPSAARQQIEWEFNYLHEADIVSFWFPCETLCPIVLYELGFWLNSTKEVVIGVHPEYQRRQDVEIQSALARGNAMTVVHSLDELAQEVVRSHAKLRKTK